MAKLLILILLFSFISLSMSYSGDEKMDKLCGAKLMHCLVHYDRDPTCGSDGKIYGNKSELKCINRCVPPEEEVKIADPSLCEPEWTNINEEARRLGRW